MAQNKNVFYARFMDDWVILAKTRWHLRRAIKKMNQILAQLQLVKHPQKTEIGRIEKGFDFLGFHFTLQGLTVAASSIKKFHEKVSRLVREVRQPVPKQRWWWDKKHQTARLYEQDPWLRVGRYVRDWMSWCKDETGKVRQGNEAGTRGNIGSFFERWQGIQSGLGRPCNTNKSISQA